MPKREVPDINPRPRDEGMAGFHELSKAIADLDFPVSRQELLDHVDTRRMEVVKGRQISLHALVSRLGQGHFASWQDVLGALHDQLVIEGLIDENRAA